MSDVADRIERAVQSARTGRDAQEQRWLMFESWTDLLLASWPIPAAALRPHVPALLDIDSFDGSAWVSLVPFQATDMRIHGLPPVPGQADFPELNFRTYVRCMGIGGVYFLSLDCPGALVSLIGTKLFGLPFKEARIRIEKQGASVRVESRRTSRGESAEFAAVYTPRGAASAPAPGSIEAFLTGRLSLFVADRGGHLHRGDVWHDPWQLQPVDARIEKNTIAAAAGLTLADTPAHVAFAARTDSLIYPPTRVTAAT